MKVFKYDVSRSARGELVADIPRPHSAGATVEGVVNLPRHNPATTSWRVIRDAGYNDSRPNLSYPFPVCFCTGEWFAGDRNARGSQGIWEWLILLPPTPTKPANDCEAMRSQFPDAVRMLECIEGDSLEDINPAEVRNLLDQCLADPAKIARAVSEFFAREAREAWDMGRGE